MHCCPSGEQVLDVCGCCPECAKAENELCGDNWYWFGRCASGLFCKSNGTSNGFYPARGFCSKITQPGQDAAERSGQWAWRKKVPICNTPIYSQYSTTSASSGIMYNVCIYIICIFFALLIISALVVSYRQTAGHN